jgi:DNA-binding transcriptional regulator YdaS (Cro superfamily)
MMLAEWLKQKGLSDDAFGALIGVTGANVWKLKKGNHRPNWTVMSAIIRVTNGAVLPNDWMKPEDHMAIEVTS